MKRLALGDSDLEITRLGLGTWAIGGPWRFGWGPQDDDDSIGAIHAALDRGFNWIDTAPAYGLGHAEEIIAKALRQSSHRPLVFTKCGIVWSASGKPKNSLAKASVIREVDDSLRRLQVDTLDLCQIHWPIPEEEIEEGCEALESLRAAGKVRHIGVSNFSVPQMERARSVAEIVSLQPPYSLVRPEVEDGELPYCQQNGLAVINYSPMGSGLLTGSMTRERLESLPADDWRRSSPRFQEPLLSKAFELVELLGRIAQKQDCSIPEVAIAWTLHHPAVTAAIVGLRRAEQLRGVARAADVELDEQDLSDLRASMPTSH